MATDLTPEQLFDLIQSSTQKGDVVSVEEQANTYLVISYNDSFPHFRIWKKDYNAYFCYADILSNFQPEEYEADNEGNIFRVVYERFV